MQLPLKLSFLTALGLATYPSSCSRQIRAPGSDGQELTLRLEFEEQPLARRQVKLMRLAVPHTIVLARTDEHGRARFTPESAGAFVALERNVPDSVLPGS